MLSPERAFGLHLPTEIRFGVGELGRVGDSLGEARVARWMVISGQGALARAGQLERLLGQLQGEISELRGVPPNPEPPVYDAAIRRARETGCDAVVGLGGGSVLDVAKVACLLAPRTGWVEDYLQGRDVGEEPGLPCLAIPTTAGTGSEVTRWATIWDRNRGRKLSLDHPAMYPRRALVDPELTASLPADLRAIAALDALSHACESCWSRASQPYSRALAFQAIRLIHEALPRALEDADAQIRERLSLASLLAGLAFSQTRTALAHSISYGLTLRFGIPHGIAASVTLPALVTFNEPASPVGVQTIMHALGARTAAAAGDVLQGLISSVPLPVSISEYGVTEADLAELAEKALSYSRATGNARSANPGEVVSILRELL